MIYKNIIYCVMNYKWHLNEHTPYYRNSIGVVSSFNSLLCLGLNHHFLMPICTIKCWGDEVDEAPNLNINKVRISQF